MSLQALTHIDPNRFFQLPKFDGTDIQRLNTQIGGVAVSNDFSGRLSVTRPRKATELHPRGISKRISAPSISTRRVQPEELSSESRLHIKSSRFETTSMWPSKGI